MAKRQIAVYPLVIEAALHKNSIIHKKRFFVTEQLDACFLSDIRGDFFFFFVYFRVVEDFRIALIQCRPLLKETPDSSLETIENGVRKASESGAALVAFPELTLSGFALTRSEAVDRALSMEHDAVRRAIELSGDYSIHIAFGLLERDGDEVFNTYVVAGNGRLAGSYRKIHIPPREEGFFAAGSQFKVFDLPFVRLGPSVCYDNEICESHLCLALKGAELIVMPAGWADHWEREDYIEPCATDDEVVGERSRWMKMMFGARCRDTGTYSALVNYAGLKGEEQWKFVGKSMVFAPTGRVVAEAQAWEEDVLIADLSSRLLRDYRNMEAFALRRRRPDTYGALVERKGYDVNDQGER